MSEEKPDFHLIHEEPKSKKDWEISDLYSRSWQIVKNHKVTWIFGAAVASMAAGSSGNFNSSGSGDSESIQKLFNNGVKEATTSGQLSQVLGDSINPLQLLFWEIVNKIPMHYYAIFVIEVLLLIIVGLIIRYIYSAWSHASLIESVNSAYKQNKTTIAEASEQGFKHIKSFIWLDIIPGSAIFLMAFVYMLAIIMAFSIGNLPVKIVAGIFTLIGIIALLYLGIIVGIGLIWAYREVAISDKGAKEAFWNGIKIARKKKSSSVILGFLNGVITGIATMIPMFAIFAVIAAGVISYIATNSVSPYLIGIGVLVIAIVIPVMIVIGAVSQAFKASVWTIAYDKIKGKYTNES